MMMKKLVQTGLQLLLFTFFSSAWGACEVEIEKAIQADADYAAPQIESMMRSNPGSRVETVSERKIKKRSMWNGISNEYKSGSRDSAAVKLQVYTKDLAGRDRASSSLGTQAATADSLAHICLANLAMNQTTSNPATTNTPMACEAEIVEGTLNEAGARSRVIAAWKDALTLSKEQLIQNIGTENKNLNDARKYNYGNNAVSKYQMHICVWNAALNGLSPEGSKQVFNSQQAQQATQQNENAQSLTQRFKALKSENQRRADQERQGKRKTNDPAAQADECIAIDQAGSGNFGAFKNICGYKVNFYSCNYKPRSIQGGFNWSADFDCEKQQFGLYTPNGGRSEAAHNRNTEMVYWFACKAPATPVDAEFIVGKGIEARCHN